MSAPTPADEPGITLEQVYAALQALGTRVPALADDPQPMNRAQALGHLLFTVEGALIVENDPIGREFTRAGYMGGVWSAVRAVPMLESDAERAYQEAWTRMLDERLARTALDLHMTWEARPGAFPTGPAVNALLAAVLPLVQATYPAPTEDAVAKQTREALHQARGFLATARQHIEAGRRKLKQLGHRPE
ncbi:MULTISPECIES: hypothetical protein [unclassified Streptomyces]|uniref:hypothetical protein n=1 Tax=unclassified Streptomyces TaxID=2593676 RepID=UPI002E2A7614|nr:hypothetical protein [Streptomyces sp. NBC_00285]